MKGVKMSTTKTKKQKNDITADQKNLHEDTITLSTDANMNINGTFTTNKLVVNPDAEFELKCCKESEKPTRFQKLVERYMKCEKKTLAEMLAMRDTEDEDWSKDFNFNEELQKILKDPNTFRVPDPVPPIQPNSPYIPPYPNYDAYCFNAPGNRCIRGNASYVGKCDGCPYLNMSWSPRITWTGDPAQGQFTTTCACTLNQKTSDNEDKK